jgi:hypothetical protein
VLALLARKGSAQKVGSRRIAQSRARMLLNLSELRRNSRSLKVGKGLRTESPKSTQVLPPVISSILPRWCSPTRRESRIATSPVSVFVYIAAQDVSRTQSCRSSCHGSTSRSERLPMCDVLSRTTGQNRLRERPQRFRWEISGGASNVVALSWSARPLLALKL